jgi:hypothetical protein
LLGASVPGAGVTGAGAGVVGFFTSLVSFFESSPSDPAQPIETRERTTLAAMRESVVRMAKHISRNGARDSCADFQVSFESAWP